MVCFHPLRGAGRLLTSLKYTAPLYCPRSWHLLLGVPGAAYPEACSGVSRGEAHSALQRAGGNRFNI